MHLKYGTSIITFVQFIAMSLLGIANSINSIVVTCIHDGSDCVSNTIPSIFVFILIAIWFGFIWMLGYAAQDRRSRRLAAALIGAELLVIMAALLNARHHTDILSLATSVIDLFLAVWVIILSVRLILANGGRVVSKQRGSRGRARQRRPKARQ